MTPQQIGKIWTTIGFALAYYALNSWIVSQGGKEIFGAKLVVDGKAPAALTAVIICGILLLLNSIVGRTFARRSTDPSWHRRIPVALLDPMDTGSKEGQAYQGFMLFLLGILPAIALAHFWNVVLSAHVLTTKEPAVFISIWDWNHFSWNDPARICSTVQEAPVLCNQNSTVLPGLEPTGLAAVSVAAVVALVFHLTAVFRPARRADG